MLMILRNKDDIFRFFFFKVDVWTEEKRITKITWIKILWHIQGHSDLSLLSFSPLLFLVNPSLQVKSEVLWGNHSLFPVCSCVSIRGLCVESVLHAKLVALAYHMWKHSLHLPGWKTWHGRMGGGVGEIEKECVCVCVGVREAGRNR